MSSRPIEKGLVSELSERVKQIDEKHFDFGEQEICKQFGCGKKLKAQEKLYGDKCVGCSGDRTPAVIQVYWNKKIS